MEFRQRVKRLDVAGLAALKASLEKFSCAPAELEACRNCVGGPFGAGVLELHAERRLADWCIFELCFWFLKKRGVVRNSVMSEMLLLFCCWFLLLLLFS